MDMKIVGITVTVLVSLVVLAGVLMPVLDDATANETKFENEGYYNLDVVIADPEETITLVFDHTKTNSISVNGVDVSMPNQTVTLVGSNGAMVRYFYAAADRVSMHMYIGEGTTGVYADSFSNQDMTVTISEGVITGSSTGPSGTKSATPTGDIYCITSGTGDYVMKPYTESVKLLGDSKFIAVGRTSVNNSNICLYAEGSIDGGVPEIDVFYEAADTTTSNVEIHATPVAGYEDLYTFENFTFDLTQGDDTVQATYSAIIVPSEVTAEKTVHFTDNENALFAVIPVIIIVAILLGVIALVIRSRLD